ncbi:hypothetical protein [uncultured Alistipes sp.]|uniref:hypothetical protein n=2 Tax=Alistipes TaxID=239759 RepID=UPI00259B32A9|nr:hypothetical protein [uncultured Alistipes sp.]
MSNKITNKINENYFTIDLCKLIKNEPNPHNPPPERITLMIRDNIVEKFVNPQKAKHPNIIAIVNPIAAFNIVFFCFLSSIDSFSISVLD